MQEIWQQMKVHNVNSYKQLLNYSLQFMVLGPDITKEMFLFGKRLHQELPVQFLAVEILDRFTIQQVTYLWNETHHPRSNWENSDNSRWHRACFLMKKQLELRMMSCLQLASKMAGITSEILRPRSIVSYLCTRGMKVSLKAVVMSERYILKILNFKLPLTTTHCYVEQLLQQLHASCKLNKIILNYDQLKEKCLLMLSVIYCNYRNIFDSLEKFVEMQTENNSYEDICAARCDRIYHASGVVLTAAWNCSLIKGETRIQNCNNLVVQPPPVEITSLLASISGISSQDIEALSSAILYKSGIQNNMEDNMHNFTSTAAKTNENEKCHLEQNTIKRTKSKRLYSIQNINIPGLPPPTKRARMRGAGKEYTTLSKLK